MRIFCVVISVFLLSGLSTRAHADAKSYCELFGRDYADAKTLDVDLWQTSYRNAFNSCMTLYTPALPETPSAEKVIKKAVTMPTQETPRKKRTPLLAPGSVAWNEYCAAKYVSFNKVTGTYKSYSGKAKPCLVPSGWEGT